MRAGAPEERLIRRAARGDDLAFAELVATHDKELQRLAFVICADIDTARDAAQETWVIAWQRLSSLRDHARFRPWIAAIAVNQARLTMRRARSMRTAAARLSETANMTERQMVQDLDLAAALAHLTPEDRSLLALDFIAGLTSAEIAPIVRLSPEGVRTRKARLLRRLREMLT